MKDHHIRTALKRKVLARHFRDPETRVFDELALRHGSSRIDIAVVNGIVHGYELKSDQDTLKRLPHQIKVYNSVLDRITLVVGHRYADEAVQIVPQWWGIKIAEMGTRGAVHFFDVRKTRNNPLLDILAVSKLLWREEALNLLNEVGEVRGLRHKPRAMIYARLAEIAGLDLIRGRVRHQLKTRKNWRSGE
jgi:hypothetical protein